MSLNSAALKLMAAKGLSIDDAIEILEALETRSAGAARQKRYRDARRNERDVTGDVTPPPYEDTSTPSVPSQDKSCSGVMKPRPSKGTRIKPDWEPERPLPADVAGLVAQWPPGRLEREMSGFRDYWLARSRDAARTDWDRTWWNRIRDQHDRVMKASHNGRRGRQPEHPNGRTIDAAEELIAELSPPSSSHATADHPRIN